MANVITDWVFVCPYSYRHFCCNLTKKWNWAFFYLFLITHNFLLLQTETLRTSRLQLVHYKSTTKAPALTNTLKDHLHLKTVLHHPNPVLHRDMSLRTKLQHQIGVNLTQHLLFKKIKPITNPTTSKTFKQKPWMMECGTL